MLPLGVLGVCLLAAGMVLSSMTCQSVGNGFARSRKKTYRFVFPEGASGRYVLRCQVPGAPPLPGEDAFRLVRFGPGVRTIETSDAYVWGNEWFVEEHFVEGATTRRRIELARGSCDPYPWNGRPPHEVVCELR